MVRGGGRRVALPVRARRGRCDATEGGRRGSRLDAVRFRLGMVATPPRLDSMVKAPGCGLPHGASFEGQRQATASDLFPRRTSPHGLTDAAKIIGYAAGLADRVHRPS